MKMFFRSIISIGMACSMALAQMTITEDSKKGTVTIQDREVDVLTYRFKDQLKEGIGPEQTRSCYIHPLYSLDGKLLTDDFPDDHLHHHGLFWTWPVIKTRGQDTQTWHPANLRQYFVRWLKREVLGHEAIISVENVWKLDGKEVVANEVVTLRAHPTDDSGRTIDVALTFEAVGGPLEFRGTPDQNKGYGGLTLRGAPVFKGLPIQTDRGEYSGEPNNVTLHWADLSTEKAGVAIFVSPDHPGLPTTWVLRTSYAGLLNVSWPGLKPATLKPGKPVTLRYRIYIHRGDAAAGHVSRAYERFLSEHKQ